MSRSCVYLAAFILLLAIFAGCVSPAPSTLPASQIEHARQAIGAVAAGYGPGSRVGLYRVGVEARGSALVVTGIVDNAQAKLDTLRALEAAKLTVTDRVLVLPDEALGSRNWGIAFLSVDSGRDEPAHKAEMGTQVLMGNAVRLLKQSADRRWFLVETMDGYPAWLEQGTFVRCSLEQVRNWTNSPLLVVTALEGAVVESPEPGAQPVSDVVVGDLLKYSGEQGEWYRVELPDRRGGFLPKTSATDFVTWKKERRPTADNLERTARRLLGRPYLWGGCSPKGLDCSGFTKLVFYLNGLELSHRASYQALQGRPVPLDHNFSQLKKGDLLFFGSPARAGRLERIRHVGMYLGDKLFIHSSEHVHISSLDPDSPIRDEARIRTLLFARRVLP